MIRVFVTVASLAVMGVYVAPLGWADPGPVYANCTEARADGAYNIPQDDPAYWEDGDRDGDGYACEPPQQ